jgi:hypothetical protein
MDYPHAVTAPISECAVDSMCCFIRGTESLHHFAWKETGAGLCQALVLDLERPQKRTFRSGV